MSGARHRLGGGDTCVTGVPGVTLVPMELVHPPHARPGRGRTALVTSVESDSHTWNLVYLQLVLEELGFAVTNLGACVPDALLVDTAVRLEPDLVVVSSVNGHGHNDGRRVVGGLRAEPALRHTPIVIGGKLGVVADDGPDVVADLVGAGYDAVFVGEDALDRFRGFLAAAGESAAC